MDLQHFASHVSILSTLRAV